MTDTPPQREQIEQALPELPEARIESYQMNSVMRTTTLHTYSDFDMREFAVDAVLAATESLRAQLVAAHALLSRSLEALTESVDGVRNEAAEAEALYGDYPPRAARVEGLKAAAAEHEAVIDAIRALSATQPQGDSK